MTPAELRTRRQALGLSMEKLARELGVTTTTVYRWESGRTGVPALLPLALERLEQRSA